MKYDVIFINSQPELAVKQRGAGPHLLASELRRHGYSALVLDFIEYWTMEEFKQAIDKFSGPNTMYVGFSITWARMGLLSDEGRVGAQRQIEADLSTESVLGNYIQEGKLPEMVDHIIAKGIKIIFGGSKASQVREMLPLDKIDHIFVGYSETQLIDLVKGQRILNKIVDHDTKAHADHTGYDFSLATMEMQPENFVTPNEILAVECSRGCRFKCKFCSYPLIGMKSVAAYTKTKENFRDQLLRNYEMFGVTKYSFVDDTFNDTTEKVRLFTEVVDSLPFDIKVWAYLRAEVLANNPEQIELLKTLGIAQCFFGVETYNQKAGRTVGKGMDPERIKEMLYNCKHSWKGQTHIQQGLIIGLPTETEESIMKTIEWCASDECPVDTTVLSSLAIVPEFVREKFHVYNVSEFDRTYADYGYRFPHLNHPDRDNMGIKDIMPLVIWEKDDGGIPNLLKAHEIAQKYQPIVNNKKSLYEPSFGIQYGSFTDLKDIRENYVAKVLAL